MKPVPHGRYFVEIRASERPTQPALASAWRKFVMYVHGGVAFVVLITSATSALAQSARHLNPENPEATVPALKYESAFSDYLPLREQKGNSWKQVNKEVADNPSMGSMTEMKGMSGKTMPGMDSKTAAVPVSKKVADGHDMGSMKGMPDNATPGTDSRSASNAMSEEGHESISSTKSETAPVQSASAHAADISGTGVVQVIDKANSKVKLSHDPIEALGWPKMTMFFRLKNSALADEIKEGEKVEFSLEKSASGYVISGWHRDMAVHDRKMK